MKQTYLSLHDEWSKNYRFHGVNAWLRCAWGTHQLQRRPRARSNGNLVEAITFSVVPKMTGLWTNFIRQAVDDPSLLITVGDCSGGFRRQLLLDTAVTVLPLLNHPHGEKLDLFFEKVCGADFVIISDDDIFWPDTTPWDWARQQLEADENVAVVSLLPRYYVSNVLQDEGVQPMGSYCLVVRRCIWMKEGLSFQKVYTPRQQGYDWVYDTADYANVQLLQRGYKVAIAPPHIQQQLITFTGISTWMLKVQKYEGDIRANVIDIPIRQEKALRAILLAQGIMCLVARFYPNIADPHLVSPTFLQKGDDICRSLLSKAQVTTIEDEIAQKIARLETKLQVIKTRSRFLTVEGH